jgi:O-acetyl-ADP-ribose deacetylase
MMEVRVGELAEVSAGAALRPVACDFSPLNASMVRFDRAAGPSVVEQCVRVGELPLGSAVITAGGDLAVPFIIHVAVRSAEENPSPAVVGRGLRNGLRRVEEWGIESVAVAPLGTGPGSLDAEESAAVMVPILADQLQSAGHLARVIVVVEDEYQRAAFAGAVLRHTGERSGAGP